MSEEENLNYIENAKLKNKELHETERKCKIQSCKVVEVMKFWAISCLL